MDKITPKQINAISDIISSANPLFFSKLSKLLGLLPPRTIEEKERLLKQILKTWEEKSDRRDG